MRLWFGWGEALDGIVFPEIGLLRGAERLEHYPTFRSNIQQRASYGNNAAYLQSTKGTIYQTFLA